MDLCAEVQTRVLNKLVIRMSGESEGWGEKWLWTNYYPFGSKYWRK